MIFCIEQLSTWPVLMWFEAQVGQLRAWQLPGLPAKQPEDATTQVEVLQAAQTWAGRQVQHSAVQRRVRDLEIIAQIGRAWNSSHGLQPWVGWSILRCTAAAAVVPSMTLNPQMTLQTPLFSCISNCVCCSTDAVKLSTPAQFFPPILPMYPISQLFSGPMGALNI